MTAALITIVDLVPCGRMSQRQYMLNKMLRIHESKAIRYFKMLLFEYHFKKVTMSKNTGGKYVMQKSSVALI